VDNKFKSTVDKEAREDSKAREENRGWSVKSLVDHLVRHWANSSGLGS
jgi:hypothetical protein